jgi:hypothetical protein
MRHRSVTFAAGLIVAGCSTNLIVEKFDEATPDGYIYYLPVREVSLKTDFVLDGCALVGSQTKLQYTANSTLSTRIIADGSVPYYIRYEELTDGTKTTNFNVSTYENQTLKSVGLDIADRSGAVITNIASVVGTVAGVALLAEGATALEECGLLSTLLQNVATTKNELITGKKKENEYQSKLDAYNKAKSAVEAADKALKAAKPGDDMTALQKNLADANASLVKNPNPGSKPDISALEQDAAEAKKKVTLTKQLSFVPNTTHINNEVKLSVDSKDLERFENLKPPLAFPSVALVIKLTQGRNAKQGNESDNSQGGLVYRQPIDGAVYVCDVSCLHDKSGSMSALLVSDTASFPQFGVKATLPLHNGAFGHNNIAASFSQDGGLVSLAYKSDSSAEAASAAAKDSTTALINGLTAGITASTGVLKALRDEADAQRAAALAKVQDRNALATAERQGKIATEKDEATLSTAERAAVLARVNDQTDLLTAIAKQQQAAIGVEDKRQQQLDTLEFQHKILDEQILIEQKKQQLDKLRTSGATR